MFPKFFDFVIRRRIWVLLTAMVCLLLAAFNIKNLQIVLEPDKLLPPNHEYTIGSRLITKEFGLKYTMVVALSKATGDFSADDLDRLALVTRQLSAVPGVIKSSVTSLTSDKVRRLEGEEQSLEVKRIYTRGKTLADLAPALQADSFYKQLLMSPDQRYLYILLECESPEKGFRQLKGKLFDVLNTVQPGMQYASTGFIPMMAAIEGYSDRVAVLLVVALLIIATLLYFRTGSLQGAVLPVLTGLTAVFLTLGTMGYFGVPIDVFNAITPVLILAVIAGHSTQILSTFTANLKAAGVQAVHQATAHRYLVATMVELSPVLLAAGLAAAAGFWSLMVFSIQSVWTFGLMAGTAIAIGVVLELTVVPALRACLKPPDLSKQVSRLSRWLDGVAGWCATKVMRQTQAVIVFFGCLLAVGVFLSTQVVVENSNKANIAPSEPVQIDDRAINTQFPGTNSLYVVLDSGQVDGVKEPAFLEKLDKIAILAQLDASVGRAVSYADHIKRLHKAVFPAAQAALPVLRKELIDEINLYELGSSPKDFSQFVDADFRKATVIIFMKDDSSSSMKRLAGNIRALQAREFGGLALYFGGSVAEAAAITEQLVNDKLLNMLQVLSVVALIAWLTFRSAVFAALVVLPLIMSVFVNFGLMALLGIPLNIPTALCAAMVVGLGADYSIYFLMKYRREVAKSQDVSAAVHASIMSAGSICLGVAVLIALGYSVLITSYAFLPHRWIGMLVVSAMLVSAMTTITLVPALLKRFKVV
jgi:uncharacterized protein